MEGFYDNVGPLLEDLLKKLMQYIRAVEFLTISPIVLINKAISRLDH